MYFEWLRKIGNRASDGGDAKKDPALAATREAEPGPPSTRELRSHYSKTFDYQADQILEKDVRHRAIRAAGGHESGVRWLEMAVLPCCQAVSSCLLEQWLLSKEQPPPARSEKVHRRADLVRCTFWGELFFIAKIAARRRDFQRPGQNLAQSFVAIAVGAITRAALEAGATLGFEAATTALAHSLLATVHQIAEYIAQCHAQGEKPSFLKRKALLSSSNPRGPEAPSCPKDAAPESASSRDPSLERPETPPSYSSRRSSYSILSATAESRAEDYISLVGHPSNTSDAAMFCRGKGVEN